MNWVEASLSAYWFIAIVVLAGLVGEELWLRRRVTIGATVDALFCALIWPVISGFAVCELVRMRRRRKP